MADLLFLTQRIPFPPTKGDKIRSWHILRHLAARHRVHLGCFIDDPHDSRSIPLLRDLCATVRCEPLNPRLAKLRSLPALVRQQPLTLSYFGSRGFQSWVNRTVADNRIERIFVFCSAMASYAAGLSGVVRVLDMVDVDSQKWLQYAETSGPVARFVYAREGRLLFRFEREMARLFDHTILVSPAEADLFRQLAPECAGRVVAVANGVDGDFFSPDRTYADPFETDTPAVVFTGAMDYRPNIEAVQWFVDAVMPEAARAGLSFDFWIVGSNPAPAVMRLAERPGVRVTGRVDDVRPYLAHAAAVVAPLLTARGIQNKVLEAMAMAKAVVATPQAREGIEAIVDEEVLVAGEPEGFASGLRTAFSERGAEIGRCARRRVAADYTWARSLQAIDALLEGPVQAPLPDTARMLAR